MLSVPIYQMCQQIGHCKGGKVRAICIGCLLCQVYQPVVHAEKGNNEDSSLKDRNVCCAKSASRLVIVKGIC